MHCARVTHAAWHLRETGRIPRSQDEITLSQPAGRYAALSHSVSSSVAQGERRRANEKIGQGEKKGRMNKQDKQNEKGNEETGEVKDYKDLRANKQVKRNKEV